MRQPPVEVLVERAGTRYAAAVIAAQRARQLSDGALPVVGTGATNPVTVALEELAAGKLRAQAPRQPVASPDSEPHGRPGTVMTG